MAQRIETFADILAPVTPDEFFAEYYGKKLLHVPGEPDKFEAVMEREGSGGRQRGFFVAFSYTSGAESECAAFHKRTGRLIKLLTVQEILDEEHVQKM